MCFNIYMVNQPYFVNDTKITGQVFYDIYITWVCRAALILVLPGYYNSKKKNDSLSH